MENLLIMFRDHIVISMGSLVIASIIGIGTGYLAIKNEKTEKLIIGLFQVLRVIPSLAVLILLIPIMGTGIMPAMTALIILAVPPILMNTVTGLRQVPDFMIETAKGQGMNDGEIMRNVRFPLALPLIFAGVRTAMIEVIASATLAAKIGGGGLGELIFTGLGLNRADLIFLGGVSVGALSLLAGLIAALIDRFVFKYKYVKG